MSAGVIVVETPALVCVEQPRQHQCTDDADGGIYPGWCGGNKDAREKGDAHAGHYIVDDGDHACRCTEKRYRGTEPERRWFDFWPPATLG